MASYNNIRIYAEEYKRQLEEFYNIIQNIKVKESPITELFPEKSETQEYDKESIENKEIQQQKETNETSIQAVTEPSYPILVENNELHKTPKKIEKEQRYKKNPKRRYNKKNTKCKYKYTKNRKSKSPRRKKTCKRKSKNPSKRKLKKKNKKS